MKVCQTFGDCTNTGWMVDGLWRCSNHWVLVSKEEYDSQTHSKKMNKDISEGIGCLCILVGIAVIILAIGLVTYLSK